MKASNGKEGVVSGRGETTRNVFTYHQGGKWKASPSKPLEGRQDLCLAYTPHVAEVCQAIHESPEKARLYTNRQNLVAVISNGTAVLGLGNIGPLASKPVMEGKSVLFQRFGGVNSVDIEIQEEDPDKLSEIIEKIAISFGGINLEDIKAPECFKVENRLKKTLDIPVFHDDQHGTAVVIGAALMNGLELVGKDLGAIKCVVSGAGAGALASIDFLISLGVSRENIFVFDRGGLIYEERPNLPSHKLPYAAKVKSPFSLEKALEGADLFLGLSGANTLPPSGLKGMAPSPIIFSLANPTPEICPHSARELRPDALIGTGRSDYPNQINNLLCFPYIFRGALDVGATEINESMKKACAFALAGLAKKPFWDTLGSEQGGVWLFNKEHLIPKPFDPRLLEEVSWAVAKAAMDSGVATRPRNLEDYGKELHRESIHHLCPWKAQTFREAYELPSRPFWVVSQEEGDSKAQKVLDLLALFSSDVTQVPGPVSPGQVQTLAQDLPRGGTLVLPSMAQEAWERWMENPWLQSQGIFVLSQGVSQAGTWHWQCVLPPKDSFDQIDGLQETLRRFLRPLVASGKPILWEEGSLSLLQDMSLDLGSSQNFGKEEDAHKIKLSPWEKALTVDSHFRQGYFLGKSWDLQSFFNPSCVNDKEWLEFLFHSWAR